jgi:hypothetical protein
MKLLVLGILFVANAVQGQVIFRNDFLIKHKKPKRIENQGITHIVFNVGPRHVWNLNAYGQPMKSISLDITALREPRIFTYREIAEKLYRPGAVFRQSYIPIPLFLIMEPPPKRNKLISRYLATRDND